MKLKKLINEDFQKIYDWFFKNKLSIEFVDKTKSINFCDKIQNKEGQKTKYKIWRYTNQTAFYRYIFRMHAR